MDSSTGKREKRKTRRSERLEAKNLPEQKMGDTPVPPWEMPTPEEKAQAEPVRRALKKVVSQVNSQEKADEVVDEITSADDGQTAEEVEQTQPQNATPADVAKRVQKAARAAPDGQKSKKVLEETARALTTPDQHQQEVIAEAAQEVFNPEQQGASPDSADARQREYLRKAVLKRLKPLDALDASLFLKVNHLPQYALTKYFVLQFNACLSRRRGLVSRNGNCRVA